MLIIFLSQKPWYKNFKGEIEKIGEARFVTNGEIGLVGSTKLEITELPIGTWTQGYKESVMEALLHGGDKEKDKTPPLIRRVSFLFYFPVLIVRISVLLTREFLLIAITRNIILIQQLNSK